MKMGGKGEFNGHFSVLACTASKAAAPTGLHRDALGTELQSSPRAVSGVQVLTLLLTKRLWVHPQHSCCCLPCRAAHCCVEAASQPAQMPWFRRRGTVRDSSLHLDPVGKTNVFVLSENIWEPGILGRRIQKWGFLHQTETLQTFGGMNMATGRNLGSPTERLTEVPQPRSFVSEKQGVCGSMTSRGIRTGRTQGLAAGALGFPILPLLAASHCLRSPPHRAQIS